MACYTAVLDMFRQSSVVLTGHRALAWCTRSSSLSGARLALSRILLDNDGLLARAGQSCARCIHAVAIA